MCSFVTKCLDINKLTDEEIECLEEYLDNRKAELQKLVKDLQERIKKVGDAEKALRRRRR